DREVRGKPGASDHAPAWIELRDDRLRRASTAVSTGKRQVSGRTPPARRPLLVIDGDFFTHRAYHALPKTILREGGRPCGAILGVANVLLRLWNAECPRAVLVAWDTLDIPTYRHRAFPAYQ